jgi:hypothetical protein
VPTKFSGRSVTGTSAQTNVEVRGGDDSGIVELVSSNFAPVSVIKQKKGYFMLKYVKRNKFNYLLMIFVSALGGAVPVIEWPSQKDVC